MRVTILRDDNTVILDGRPVTVDCSTMLASYHAVQWDGAAGRIELKSGGNIAIATLDSFAAIVAAAVAALDAADAPAPLDQVRAAALAQIDQLAGLARARFITVAAGQDMTYLEKVRQAQAVVDAIPGTYPLIAGEVGLTGETEAAVAQVILGRYAAWQQIGAVIEHTRLTAKRDVAQAADAAAIAGILAGLEWPAP
jgi:hypothetical protein